MNPTDSALTIADAEAALAGVAIAACMTGSLAYMKELRDKCLRAGIPALVAAPAPGRG